MRVSSRTILTAGTFLQPVILVQSSQECVAVDSDGGDELEELNDVEPTLATFHFRHKRLRARQSRRQLFLRQIRFLANLDKKLPEAFMLSREH